MANTMKTIAAGVAEENKFVRVVSNAFSDRHGNDVFSIGTTVATAAAIGFTYAGKATVGKVFAGASAIIATCDVVTRIQNYHTDECGATLADTVSSIRTDMMKKAEKKQAKKAIK